MPEPTDKRKVTVAIPSNGWIRNEAVQALILISYDQRYDITLRLGEAKPYEANLHSIVADFLLTDGEYFLTFDADNPPPANVLDLVELDKDIIGCPTPVWTYDSDTPFHLNAYDKAPGEDRWKPHFPHDGLQRVDAVGSGCLLISRRVLEAVKAPFLREWNDDGTQKTGGDLMFSRRCVHAGFEVYAHFDYPCRHFTTVELGRCTQQIGNLMTRQTSSSSSPA